MLKFQPEEFIVEEITEEGKTLKVGEKTPFPDESIQNPNNFFSRFILQKRLWETNSALRKIAQRLYVTPKRMNCAGNKDRNAVTVQMCSAFAVKPEKLLALKIKDIEINGAWLSNEKVKMGGLLGNRFTISLNEENVGKEKFERMSAEKINATLEKNNFAIPNFFGPQRFGSMRRNTHLVGKSLVQGKIKEAVMNYLCYSDENEENIEAKEARKRLLETMDFKEALQKYPGHLRYEIGMISHLEKLPNDFLGAFRMLPRTLQLLFLHAYESHLFNELLRKRIERKALSVAETGDAYCKMNGYGFPEAEKAKKIKDEKEKEETQKMISEGKAVLLGNIIGSESELTEEEEVIMKEEGIGKENFSQKSFPELECRGDVRPLFVFLKDFSAERKEESLVLKFSLPAGSYATTAIDFILQNQIISS